MEMEKVIREGIQVFSCGGRQELEEVEKRSDELLEQCNELAKKIIAAVKRHEAGELDEIDIVAAAQPAADLLAEVEELNDYLPWLQVRVAGH
jgi:hypothetical protein